VKTNLDDIKQEFVTHNENIFQDQIRTIKRAKETGVADFAETFYKHIGDSEYWEVYSSLKEITYLQNYLKSNQIPYLFTCADNSIIYNYTVSNADATIASLAEQIFRNDGNWFWFEPGVGAHQTINPRGFYQWAMENKYKVGTTHPLEDAHKDASILMRGKFNELVKKIV
jgi:hypothetical protein